MRRERLGQAVVCLIDEYYTVWYKSIVTDLNNVLYWIYLVRYPEKSNDMIHDSAFSFLMGDETHEGI